MATRNAATGRMESSIDPIISARIMELYRGGMKPKQIPEQVGLSISYVYSVLRKNDVAPPRKPSAQYESQMEALYREGMPMQAIADKFGLKHATVWRYLHSLGIARPRGCGAHKLVGVTKGRRAVSRDGVKLCTYCEHWKSLELFPYSSVSLDGKRPHCNDCQNLKRNARRRRARHATPAWVDKEAINAIYEEAQRRTQEEGLQYHVDHIVPLHGRRVSGLHTPQNLRVITKAANLAKRNSHESDQR